MVQVTFVVQGRQYYICQPPRFEMHTRYHRSMDTWDDRDTRDASSRGRSDEGNIFRTMAEIHESRDNPSRPHPPSNDAQSGIYSDVQELPPSDSVVSRVYQDHKLPYQPQLSQ